jgi:hypothetical protein
MNDSVVSTGLEPVTFAMSMQRSSQLSYETEFFYLDIITYNY